MKKYEFNGKLESTYIDPELLKKIENLPSVNVLDELHNTEENIVEKVLKKYLGRDLDLEQDAKKVEILKRVGVYDKYLIAYDGEVLGAVKTTLTGPERLKEAITANFEIIFDPNDKTL